MKRWSFHPASWIWAVLVTCFSQHSVAEVILGYLWSPSLERLCLLGTLLPSREEAQAQKLREERGHMITAVQYPAMPCEWASVDHQSPAEDSHLVSPGETSRTGELTHRIMRNNSVVLSTHTKNLCNTWSILFPFIILFFVFLLVLLTVYLLILFLIYWFKLLLFKNYFSLLSF